MPTTPDQTQTANPASPMLVVSQQGGQSAQTAPPPSGGALGAAAAPLAQMQQPTPVPNRNNAGAVVPASSPTQQAQQMQTARHSALGKLTSFLLGSENQYRVNPQTGQVEDVPIKRKPGELFRSILSGTLLGMAAGSKAHDFAGGFGQGGAAVMQNNQQQDQQRYLRAQQQADNFQRQQSFNEEKRLHDAQIAQMNSNNLRADWEMGFESQKFIDEHNDRERAFQLQLDQMGATPMQIQSGGQDINGQMGNGAALQKIAGTDLDAVKAPDGYHTLHTMDIDTTGLVMKGGQWVDANGNPVDISTRTKHTLYQLPDNVWNRPADGVKTGDDLNKIVGFQMMDPKATIHMTVGDVMSARSKGQEVALKDAQIKVDAMKARLEAANALKQTELAGKSIDAENFKNFQAMYMTTKEKVDSLKAELKDREATGEDTSDTQKELDDATADLESVRERLFPDKTAAKGGGAPGGGTTAPPKPVATGPKDETGATLPQATPVPPPAGGNVPAGPAFRSTMSWLTHKEIYYSDAQAAAKKQGKSYADVKADIEKRGGKVVADPPAAVSFQMPNGQTGIIPADQADAFAKANPLARRVSTP